MDLEQFLKIIVVEFENRPDDVTVQEALAKVAFNAFFTAMPPATTIEDFVTAWDTIRSGKSLITVFPNRS